MPFIVGERIDPEITAPDIVRVVGFTGAEILECADCGCKVWRIPDSPEIEKARDAFQLVFGEVTVKCRECAEKTGVPNA